MKTRLWILLSEARQVRDPELACRIIAREIREGMSHDQLAGWFAKCLMTALYSAMVPEDAKSNSLADGVADYFRRNLGVDLDVSQPGAVCVSFPDSQS